MKNLKKIYNWVLIIVSSFIFLIIASIALLNFKVVQNFIVHKTCNYLSSELKTTIKIDNVEFKFFNTIVLNDFYIEDLRGDTLGFFNKLSVGFNYRILFDKKLNLSHVKNVKIENSVIKFIQYKGQKNYNYEFLVDYFSAPSKSPSTGNYFKLIVNSVKLKNVRFVLKNESSRFPEGRIFNENNLVISNIYSHIKPFKLIGDSMILGIKRFSFTEKSGLRIIEFSSKTTISSTLMEFEDLKLKTPHSLIKNYAKLSYNGWSSFSDFDNRVKMKFQFDGTEISTKDLALFSDYLKKYNFNTSINGTAKGSLAKFNSDFLKIKIGELNTLEGRVNLTHLSSPSKLSYNLYLSKMMLNPSNLQDLLNVKMPQELLRVGSIKYSGILKGTLQNITSIGLFETTVGNIRTDILFVFDKGKEPEYKGEIDAFSLNTGKIFNTSKSGMLTMFCKIDGKGFSIDKLNTQLLSNIDSYEFNGYKYSNSTIDGVFEKKKFTGNLEMNDPNAIFSINGNFDFNGEKPTGKFVAKSESINLKKLGFGDININKLKDVNIEFEGKDIDNIAVHALLSEIELEKNNELFSVGNIKFDAFGEFENRSVQLSSNLGNISLSGNYKLSRFDKINRVFLHNLFPEFYQKEKYNDETVDIRFDMEINDSRLLSSLFFPQYKFNNFTCSGVYNSQNQNLDIVAMADNLSFRKYLFNSINIQSQKNPDKKLSLTATVDNVFLNDSFLTKDLKIAADIGINDIDFKLNLSDTTDNLSIKSGGKILFSGDTIGLNLNNSSLFVFSKEWKISDNNFFSYINNTLNIDSFLISNGTQYILANGNVGNDVFSDLNLNINEFNLNEINPLLRRWNIELQGISNCKISLNGNNSKPIIKSDISVSDLYYNGDSVGDLELKSRNMEGSYKMFVAGIVKNGLINSLNISGSIDVTPQNEKLNLILALSQTSIKPFESITKGLFSNVKGVIDTAILKIKGDFKKIETEGEIDILNASLFMDYLGVPLNIKKAKIKMDNNKISLGEFEVTDKYGAKAIAGGNIFHNNFDKFRYAIFMKELKNFNCMNLTEEQGDLFFGNAFVDGNMVLNGTINDLYLNINAKSRPKTVISLPLASTTETTGPEYIKIVDLRGDTYRQKSKSLTGITMDFNFNVTNDAEVRLIFDSKFDDVIKATGEGSIKMELTTFGDFYMYGSYIIDKGSYNFTALNNLVNKNLKVKNGGKIIWNGNPYEAVIDLVATTTVNADPSIIIPSTNIAGTNKSVGINCDITLKDNLFHPQITLGIDISDENQSSLFSNTDLTNAINLIKTDQEEVNKQFINLLVFNSFAPSTPGISTATTSNLYSSVQNSIGAFMTTQVNNWLKQIDPNWELGIDWSNSANTETQKQIMVSLKRKLFNERIEVGGVYGQAGNTSYDLNLSYKIKQDGKLRLRGFNRRATDPLSGSNTYINTSGLGLYYRKELDYLFPGLRKKIYEIRHK